MHHLSAEEKTEIIVRYVEGETSGQLSGCFGVSNTAILRVLRNAHIPRRGLRKLDLPAECRIVERYIHGESSSSLAKEFGVSDVTILNLLRRTAIPRRDPSKARMVYPIWHEAFSTLTAEAAYWIGFLMADGCVLDESKVQLVLAAIDLGHVEKFRHFLRTDTRPIYHVLKTKACGLKIHSRQIVADLVSYGVVPRKSSVATAKGGIEKHPAFWLGVMDGDGTIDPKRTAVKLFGTKSLMTQFSEFLTNAGIRGYRNAIPSVHRVRRNGDLYAVCIGGLRAASFLRLVYDSSPTWLDRKREKADLILSRLLEPFGPRGGIWRPLA